MAKRMLLLIFVMLPEFLHCQEKTTTSPGALDTLYFEPHNMGVMYNRKGPLGFATPMWHGNSVQWPSGSGKYPVFWSSFFIAGKVMDLVKVSGNFFTENYKPGPLKFGSPSIDPNDRGYRIYRIRRGDDVSNPDYAEWPADLGAPVNPDRTPKFCGDEQIFFVMNDNDTTSLWENLRSDPLGVEIQCLAWTHGAPVLDDVQFIKFSYINKTDDTLRDTYIMHWSDPDLGNELDDMVGSDSLRNFVYAYNSSNRDEFYGIAPAFGIVMLQTPRMRGNPDDSARWRDGYIRGYNNISGVSAISPMKHTTSLIYPISEPHIGKPDTPLKFYQFMKGRGLDVDILNSLTGEPSRFWFSGDPISGMGWTQKDDILLSNGERFQITPQDQRMAISTGPFDFKPADTQEVVIAYIAARAAHNTSPIQGLRDLAETALAAHNGYLLVERTSVSVQHTDRDKTVLALSASGKRNISLKASVLSYTGDTLREVMLYDDGMHGDGQPDDGLYANSVELPAQETGVNISYAVSDTYNSHRIPGRLSVPLVGPVRISDRLLIEEYNDDGRVNPDEDVRYVPVVSNESRYSFSEVHVEEPIEIPRATVRFDMTIDTLHTNQALPRRINGSFSGWNPADGALTYSANMTDSLGSVFKRYFDVSEGKTNIWWRDSVTIRIEESQREAYDALMIHIRGFSNQRLGVRILNPSALQDRLYKAEFSGGYTLRRPRAIMLEDSLTGVALFSAHQFDEYAGPAPETDGFRIVRGTISGKYFSPSYEVTTSNDPRWENLFWNRWLVGKKALKTSDYQPIYLVMDSSRPQLAYRYVDGRYRNLVNVPMRAYITDDDNSFVQVCLGLSENGDNPLDENFWSPYNMGKVDNLIIFPHAYTSEELKELTSLIFRNTPGHDDLDTLKALAFVSVRSLNGEIIPIPQDTIQLSPIIPPTEGDVYIFNPRHVLFASRKGEPASFEIGSTYPNPFRGMTTINFETTEDTQTLVEIYNTLGKRVQTLHNGYTQRGKYTLFWDGRWENGDPADSGAYFLLISAQGKTMTRSLIMLK